MSEVATHVIARVLHDDAVDPAHAERAETPAFRAAKERLKQDGHYACWVCGTTDSIEIHHRAAEWMFAALVDYDRLKEFCEEWDPFGYGRLLRKQPITTVDDVRNCLPLCTAHHRSVDHADGGGGTGIHSLTFPTWLMQKLAQPGLVPVPQPGETFADALKRVTTAP
jgi:hypothetical protein